MSFRWDSVKSIKRGSSSLASFDKIGTFAIRPFGDKRPEMLANIKVEFFRRWGGVIAGGRGGGGGEEVLEL